jgi:hypothetical protein
MMSKLPTQFLKMKYLFNEEGECSDLYIYVVVFWVKTLCSLIGVNIFEGTCCLHLQDRISTLKMKTACPHNMHTQGRILLLVLY